LEYGDKLVLNFQWYLELVEKCIGQILLFRQIISTVVF